MTIKIERLISRDDGSQIKIVAELWCNLFGKDAIHAYTLRRDSADLSWSCCGTNPANNWREMSVDEYVRSGRSELLRYASPAELLSVSRDLLVAAEQAGVRVNL